MGNLKTVLVKLGITLSIFLGVYLAIYFCFDVVGLAKEPKMMNEYKSAYTQLKELETEFNTLSAENNEEANKEKIEELKSVIILLEEEIQKVKE